MSSKVRFGILACSKVARRRFMPAVAGAKNAELVMVSSRDLEKAKAFASEFKVPKSGSYEDVLNNPEIDAVYISTPPTLHEHWTRKALEHGKHVYCEKPSFTSFENCSDLVKLARSKGLRLMEGYMFRYHRQHAMVREWIRDGKIGTPRAFHGINIYPDPVGNDIRLDPKLGGGVFMDAAGYPVAACLDTFQEEAGTVFCDMSYQGQVDNAVSISIGFKGGQMAQCFAAFGLQYKSSYSITGTKGRIEAERAYAIDPDRKTSLTLETDSGAEKFEVPPTDQFRLMIEDFSNQLGKPEPKEGSFESKSLRLHQLLSAARRSYSEKNSVKL